MAQAMGAIGIGATIAGGMVAAEGAKTTAQATQRSYNYQAGVSEINSKIDLQNADYARTQGEIQASQYGLKQSQIAGKIRASQGASNLDVNSGSAVAVQESQKKIGGMDTAQIRSNAAKVAYDYDVKSVMDRNQAGLFRMAGDNAIVAGDIQATSSILGSVSSVASQWTKGQQSGMWGGGGTSSGGGDYSGTPGASNTGGLY